MENPLHRRLILIFSALLALIMMIQAAAPTSANSPVIPPHKVAGSGTDYGELSAAWWEYMLSIPADQNPLLDATGKGCATGKAKDGRTILLAGALGGMVTRGECVVPAGEALFFSMVNGIDVHLSGDGLDTAELVR